MQSEIRLLTHEHIEEVKIDGLMTSTKFKKQAKFNETIDHLIRTLYCNHS